MFLLTYNNIYNINNKRDKIIVQVCVFDFYVLIYLFLILLIYKKA